MEFLNNNFEILLLITSIVFVLNVAFLVWVIWETHKAGVIWKINEDKIYESLDNEGLTEYYKTKHKN